MIRYKVNVCDELKKAGYTSYKLRKENVMGSTVWGKLHRQEPVSLKVLGTVCGLLNKQPEDLIEFVNG